MQAQRRQSSGGYTIHEWGGPARRAPPCEPYVPFARIRLSDRWSYLIERGRHEPWPNRGYLTTAPGAPQAPADNPPLGRCSLTLGCGGPPPLLVSSPEPGGAVGGRGAARRPRRATESGTGVPHSKKPKRHGSAALHKKPTWQPSAAFSSCAPDPQRRPRFATVSAHLDVRPHRVRHPADCSFTSGCVPPLLAETQLLSVTGPRPSPGEDFHLAGSMRSGAHECGGPLPLLEKTQSDNGRRTSVPDATQVPPPLRCGRAWAQDGARVATRRSSPVCPKHLRTGTRKCMCVSLARTPGHRSVSRRLAAARKWGPVQPPEVFASPIGFQKKSSPRLRSSTTAGMSFRSVSRGFTCSWSRYGRRRSM